MNESDKLYNNLNTYDNILESDRKNILLIASSQQAKVVTLFNNIIIKDSLLLYINFSRFITRKVHAHISMLKLKLV